MTNSDKSEKTPKDRTWGIGIAVLYTAFVLAMLGLVFLASLERFDLVDKNYYEDGIKYQERIDQMKLANSAPYKLDISLKKPAQQLELTFPAAIPSDSISGKIVLFRASNAALDRNWDITADDQGKQQLDLSTLRHGSWKVMVYWKAGAADLYTEKTVFID